MFKDALKSLGSSVLKAGRETFSAYNPTPENIVHGVFDQLAQQGIANLSYRSPIMASLANVAMENFQKEIAKKQQINEYIKSKEGAWLKPKAQADLGNTATEKQINAEMYRIVDKISSAIKQDGIEATKKSGIFKEYEKFFEQYNAEVSKSMSGVTQEATTSSAPVNNDILNRIEQNTRETANTLDVLTSKENLKGPSSSPDSKNAFIDPLTGMPSVAAAVGSISGTILGKIFDEDMIDKFADKAKSIFSTLTGYLDNEKKVEPVVTKVEPVVTKVKKPVRNSRKTGIESPSIDEILNSISLDLNTDPISNKLIFPTRDNTQESNRERVTKFSEENISESAVELSKTEGTHWENLQTSVDEILKEIKNKEPETTKTEPEIPVKKTGIENAIDSTKDKLIDKLKDAVKSPSAIRTTASGALSTARSAVTAGLGVGGLLGGVAMLGAGAITDSVAGLFGKGNKEIDYKQDDKNWEKMTPVQKLESGAARGVEKAGNFLFMDNMSNEARASRIKAESEFLSDKTPTVTSQRANYSKELAAITAKSIENNKKSVEALPPIVLNNTNNTQSSGSNQPQIIVPSSIRNPDSTFERVQMQDFWPRVN